MTIDGQSSTALQAISPVQEMGISHVGWEVFVTEPDRQQAIAFSVCPQRDRERRLRKRERERKKKMKEKRREREESDIMRREREKELKNVSKTKKTPDELSHNNAFVRKFRILPVFSIIYTIRVRFSSSPRMNSEWVSRRRRVRESVRLELAESSGGAGPSRSKASGMNSAAGTAAVKSDDEARLLGIAKYGAKTESKLAVSKRTRLLEELREQWERQFGYRVEFSESIFDALKCLFACVWKCR